MGSASREALAQAKATLNTQLETGTGVALLALAAQINEAPGLLGALSDHSATGAARGALVDRVFTSAPESARGVVRAAVEGNWSTPAELVDGIEELGLRAVAISDPKLADELLTAASVVDSNHELELGLGNKLGDPAAKVALVERLFSGKLTPEAVSVVRHFVTNPRGRRLSAALNSSAHIAADQGGSELATVTVASPLSSEQHERLASLLEKTAGRPVRVTTVIDPSLVGGVRVHLGDHVIDGSIRSRLDDLRLKLAG